ncbi:SDR family NAD(P)-dependent oxidoreductase [Roseovarius sp. SK2]|uniref:SDR family NAD(P)-dependent oxidoreductase n=1 Tax=Roseovarius TaxID=74030 RepID=UPI00237A6AC6|nr:SDR family oxidoreductase [Roseovarius sp. SK2]MDD9727155.1 SDR family NAD(P)-dependent oxidoreductase [Roseovarius sp. SK2]
MRIEDNTVALVTGGGSGIGRSLAREVAARGATAICADMNQESAEETVTSIRADGGRALAISLDVADRKSWAGACDEILGKVGHVDIIFNNAGVTVPKTALSELPPEQWDRLRAVNLDGVYNGIHYFMSRLYGGGRGNIVNTASICGLVTCAGSGAYIASKFAVLGLSEALRFDLEDSDVGVSVLCPGFVRTGLAGSAGDASSTNHASLENGMAPEDIARIALDGVEADHFYLLTHGEYAGVVANRNRTIEYELAAATRSDGRCDDVDVLAAHWNREKASV